MKRQDPAAYGTRVVRPADFDAFWERVLTQADSVNLNASISIDPLRSSDQVEVFVRHRGIGDARTVDRLP